MSDEVSHDELSEDVRELVEAGRMTPDEGVKWTALKSRAENCTACKLHHYRSNVVFGEGCIKAPFLFVGEAPGAQEDAEGRPFVGRSGKLLRQCMWEAGFRKGDVYITNTIKCRPPKNRTPEKDESGNCFMHLWHQLELIKPKVIVAVGSVALDSLVGKPKRAIGTCRGDALSTYGYRLVPVWHPSYVLRTHQALHRRELVKDLGKAFAHVYPEGRTETDD